jgi:hypothetical protein
MATNSNHVRYVYYNRKYMEMSASYATKMSNNFRKTPLTNEKTIAILDGKYQLFFYCFFEF